MNAGRERTIDESGWNSSSDSANKPEKVAGESLGSEQLQSLQKAKQKEFKGPLEHSNFVNLLLNVCFNLLHPFFFGNFNFFQCQAAKLPALPESQTPLCAVVALVGVGSPYSHLCDSEHGKMVQFCCFVVASVCVELCDDSDVI